MEKSLDNIKTKKDFKKTLISIAVPIALQNLMLALVGASDALISADFHRMPYLPFQRLLLRLAHCLFALSTLT